MFKLNFEELKNQSKEFHDGKKSYPYMFGALSAHVELIKKELIEIEGIENQINMRIRLNKLIDLLEL